MPGYPLLLELTDKRVCVVGAGAVGTRRARTLLEAGALVTVIAPTGTDEMAAFAVDWQRRRYADGDTAGAWLVHAATDDPVVNAQVAAAAERDGIWCVRADDAARSAAWVPAVVRSSRGGDGGDVVVAVNAAGNPRMAMAVRDAIGDILPGIVDSALTQRRRR